MQIFCTFIGGLQQLTRIQAVITEDKVIGIFCIMDEFCKNFASECVKKLLLEDKEHRQRNRGRYANIVHSRHRSIHNFIMNICSALTAYSFFENKLKALSAHVERTIQLTLF